MAFYRSHVLVCVDPECLAKGAHEVVDALQDEFIAQGLNDEIQVLETSRIGGCANGPEMMVYPEGVHYVGMTPDDIPYLVEEHFLKGRVVERFREVVKPIVDEELGRLAPQGSPHCIAQLRSDRPEQHRRLPGERWLSGAWQSLVRNDARTGVIDEVLNSGLRGRGGAGFPAAKKWKITRDVQDSPKYMICNADEGDPGAFMNRRVLEGDPHSVIEGMIIAAYAVGASYGYIYCRAEYPIAVETLNIAIAQAREFGFLGKNILGTDFSFDLEVRVGAGAFVCGEETALIASIMGMRGEPHPRPPFPSVKGVWDKPSNNNNVETYSNVPQIILNGAAWYASMGTEKSKGTKTFAVGGNVVKPGLIEVPMGITLREIIFDVAGGIKDGHKFKAVQTGGPMGGCLTEEHLDLQLDYEALTKAGSMMGSGGLVVMDETSCMVDIARFFMDFTQAEVLRKVHALPRWHPPHS